MTYGPIKVGDVSYGPYPSLVYEFDPQQTAAFLLVEGLAREDVWGLLSTTKTQIESGLKKLKRKDLIDRVFAQAAWKITETFEFAKNGKVIELYHCEACHDRRPVSRPLAKAKKKGHPKHMHCNKCGETTRHLRV